MSEQQKLISKPVLIPFSLNLNTTSLKNNAQSWLDKYDNNLKQLGFEFAVLGENEVMVRQVPALLNASDLKNSIKNYIDNVINNGTDFLQALIDIIVNDNFSNSPTDWNMLLRDLENKCLDEIKNSYHQISDNDLAVWFKK